MLKCNRQPEGCVIYITKYCTVHALLGGGTVGSEIFVYALGEELGCNTAYLKIINQCMLYSDLGMALWAATYL